MKILKFSELTVANELDQWNPPSTQTIRRVLGDVWYKDRLSQAKSWMYRHEESIIGKGGSLFTALEYSKQTDFTKPSWVYTNKFAVEIVKSSDDMFKFITDIYTSTPRLQPALEFETFQRHGGYGTWGWDYQSINKTSIAAVKEYNRKPIAVNEQQYEVGLTNYLDEVSPLFAQAVFKYDLKEGVLGLPANSYWAGPEAKASSEFYVDELSEGFPLMGSRYTVRYDKNEIMNARKAFASIGYYAGVLKGSKDVSRRFENDDYLTLREILLYEMVVKNKGKVDMWIDMVDSILDEIGQPLKPGLRVQHAWLEAGSAVPKLRIFMMNFILINVLFAPLVHWFQGQASVSGVVHSSWVEKQEMIDRFSNVITSKDIKKFLSIDYSKFDHTVPRPVGNFIIQNFIKFCEEHSNDAETKRILGRLKPLATKVIYKSYLMYPAITEHGVGFENIKLVNHLPSGIIWTQLLGTWKSHSDIRAYLMDKGVDPTGRVVTLSDDIIAFLNLKEYTLIGGDYDAVNEDIAKFFTHMGATVNPKKQPPSHDWGVFLQYLITPDPVLIGYYSRQRTWNKLRVPEFRRVLSATNTGILNQINVDRVGQIAALTNVSRMRTFLPQIDKVDQYMFTEFLKTDKYLAAIIKGGYSEDVQSSGQTGAWFELLLKASAEDPEILAHALGISVYDSTGLRAALVGGRFRSNILNTLPVYYTRTLHAIEVAARTLDGLPDIELAARRVLATSNDVDPDEETPSTSRSRIKKTYKSIMKRGAR